MRPDKLTTPPFDLCTGYTLDLGGSGGACASYPKLSHRCSNVAKYFCLMWHHWPTGHWRRSSWGVGAVNCGLVSQPNRTLDLGPACFDSGSRQRSVLGSGIRDEGRDQRSNQGSLYLNLVATRAPGSFRRGWPSPGPITLTLQPVAPHFKPQTPSLTP